jgi:uncharacterized membrane protein YphA (DoxX/SURF4 family)
VTNAVRLAARLLLAYLFVRSGLEVLRKPEPRVASASWLLDRVHDLVPFLPADNRLLVRANAALQVGAGGLLALGQQAQLDALLLAASLVPTTLGGHPFWRHDDPASRSHHRVHFDKNLAILGGLLAVALDTSDRRRRAWR